MSKHYLEYSPYHQVIAQVLAHRRRALGLSQAELADRTGVAQSLVSRIERGAVVLDVNGLRRFATALGYTPSQVIALADQGVQRLEDRGVKVTSGVPGNNVGPLLAAAGVGALIAALLVSK